jgi:hypothetical protein
LYSGYSNVNWQIILLVFKVILYYVIVAKCKAMVVIETPKYRTQQLITSNHEWRAPDHTWSINQWLHRYQQNLTTEQWVSTAVSKHIHSWQILLINQVSQQCRIFFNMLTVNQLVKKFPDSRNVTLLTELSTEL